MHLLTLFGGAFLLLACWDVSSCVSFYRETNRRPPEPRSGRRLAPERVTLRHALQFMVQKANYYWQLVTALALLAKLHLRPKRTTDRDVAMLLVNTTLATWTTTRPIGPGAVHVTLRFDGFAFPFQPDRHDNRLHVEMELRLTQAPRAGTADVPFDARILRFDFDDAPVESRAEMLSIFAIMISSVVHPIVHSFENEVYRSSDDPRLAAFDDFFLHGQYLNWCAWYWPGLFFRIGPRGHFWYRRVLEFNAELPLPANHAQGLVPLAPYSRTVRFLLASRPVMVRLCREHAVPMNLEALFVCTILHAVDHHSCGVHTDGHLMCHDRLPNRGWFNLIALLFYRPAQHFWTNLLRDKRGRNPLYEALYTELRRIDPGLADVVTLSISY